ncbi:protein SFI1 homolog isoform X2 [Bombina bombina]|uniref:protein SFI1 homolog isoform X2 n=1 Tax=Bombina bombina TaxID=8345 RepID=UPI00235B2145|nr:protein SFI1 homolog isoform X2 [Bombina bombina]
MEKAPKGRKNATKSGTVRPQDRGLVPVVKAPGSLRPHNARSIPYRVTYTWNRGGRLKELRIRHLARKFFHLWVRNTFGRVLLSTARHHHNRRVLRLCFGIWKEEWWILRKEWKLSIRADCHHRYVLYNVCFLAWRSYLLIQHKKKQKHNIAENHVKRRILCRTWQQWMVYVKICRIKQHMLSEALEFREQKYLRNALHLWAVQLQRRHTVREMEDLALKHWAFSLQIRAWLQWRDFFLQTEEDKQKEAHAVKHHWCSKLKASLQAWLSYVHYRQEKQKQHKLALLLYHQHLAQRYFSEWHSSFERVRSVQAVEEHCRGLATRCVLRRTFIHWKHYVLKRSGKTHLQILAQAHYRRHLLKFGMGALKKNTRYSQTCHQRRLQAVQQYRVTLVLRAWTVWKFRMEQKEDQQLLTLTVGAQTHYRSVLMQKCFSTWLMYREKRKLKQASRSTADRHYAKSLLPRTFQQWKYCHRLKRHCRKMEEHALNFYRQTVQRRILLTWWTKHNLQKENRLAERLSILHYNWRLAERYWCTWKEQTESRQAEQEAEKVAAVYCWRRQLLTALYTWQENVQEIKARRIREEQASCHYCQCCVQKAWRHWRTFVLHGRMKRQKQLSADRHYCHCLLTRVFGAWKHYHRDTQNILQIVKEKEKQQQSFILHAALCTWRTNAEVQAMNRKQEVEAALHYRDKTLSQVLQAWRDAASIRAYYREQKAEAVRDAAVCLQRERLRCFFLYWKELGNRSAKLRIKMETATMHHGRVLLSKFVKKWKMYHDQCIRKKLLQLQEDWFAKRRLTHSSFRQWQQMVVEKQRQDKLTVQALWHWSFTLKGKVLDGWLEYTWERRRRKSRITDAVEVYRADLMQEGVTRILRYMSGMKQFRSQLITQHQVKEVYTQHLAARRCAMIWKEKVFRKRSLPPNQKKKVTFQTPCLDVQAETSLPAQQFVKNKVPPAPLATGEPVLSTITLRSERLKPRSPEFLQQSLEREGLLSTVLSCCIRTDYAETHQISEIAEPRNLHHQETVQLLLPDDSRSQAATVPANIIWTSVSAAPLPTACQLVPNPALMPPSSFMPLIQKEASTKKQSPCAEVPQKIKPSSPDYANLLHSPSDFLHEAGPRGDADSIVVHSLHPNDRESSDIQNELLQIQHIMQEHLEQKQELKAWCRYAGVLRGWVETHDAVLNHDEQSITQDVQSDLLQLELQIEKRKQKLDMEKTQMQGYISRIQEIRILLDCL